jgi:hypothetical protein
LSDTLPVHLRNGRSLLPDALEHLRRGWSVFPVLVERREDGSWSKTPLVRWKPLQERRPTEDELRAMWEAHPNANAIGVALGPASGGLCRVDTEGPVPQEFLDLLAPTRLDKGGPPLAFTSVSGGRGYLHTSELHGLVVFETLWKGGKHEELRYQGQGNYTVVPPSPGYTWDDAERPVTELPWKLKRRLLDRAAEKVMAKARRDSEPQGPAPRRTDLLEALERLKPERCDDRDQWRNVVFALHSAGGEYFEAAKEWSQRSAKHKPGDVESLWDWCGKSGGQPIPAKAVIEWAQQDCPGWQPSTGYKCRLVGCVTHMKQEYRTDWAVGRILVMREPAVIGGPQKSLKTSIAMDLALSLASGKDFLGYFRVHSKRRTAFISGESGEATLQDLCRRVLLCKGIDGGAYEELEEQLYFDFTLPKVSSPSDLSELTRGLRDAGVQVLVLDPLYLCLLAGNTRANAANLFDMGPLLQEVTRACLDAGATPILIAHSRKDQSNRGGPMDLEHIAFSGTQQFARQWFLVNPRARFDPDTGTHRLHFSVGGSAGQGGYWHLDVVEARLNEDSDGGRVWKPALRPASIERAKAEAKQLNEHTDVVLAALVAAEGESTLHQLRVKLKDAGLQPRHVDAAVDALAEGGKVEKCEVKAGRRTGAGVRLLDQVAALTAAVKLDPALAAAARAGECPTH